MKVFLMAIGLALFYMTFCNLIAGYLGEAYSSVASDFLFGVVACLQAQRLIRKR